MSEFVEIETIVAEAKEKLIVRIENILTVEEKIRESGTQYLIYWKKGSMQYSEIQGFKQAIAITSECYSDLKAKLCL